MIKKKLTALLATLLVMVSLAGCGSNPVETKAEKAAPAAAVSAQNESGRNVVDLSTLPPFSGKPYVVINNNEPSFSQEDMKTTSVERYSDLDPLGRCGPA